MNGQAQPIVIKKKVVHGGHHGGAWKVAYADFVTALMALFIVLWLTNSSKQVQDAVGGYFKDPTGTSKKIGTSMQGSGQNLAITKENMAELKNALQKSMQKTADFEKLKEHIEMTVTAEGLRIELMETSKGTFFELGSTTPTPEGRGLLVSLAHEIGKLPNRVTIEGHTDSKPFGNENYTNWELSGDRAQMCRRLMQANGMRADQVSQVRGYADQQLKNKNDPEDPSNRRISLIIQYVTPPAENNKGSQAEKTPERRNMGTNGTGAEHPT